MFSVIFDMDGTLLDTQSIYVEAWEHAGELRGIHGMGEHVQYIAGTNEKGSRKYVAENFPDVDVDAFRADVKKYIADNLVVRYKSGAKELLDFLRENGVKMALASGTSSESVAHHLDAVGASDYFAARVCGMDVENGKPAPDIFLRAASLIGAEPSECFVFEDAANGIRAGHAAGMRCVGVADIVPFSSDVKKLMFKELSSLDEAIEFLTPYVEGAEV